MRKTKISIVVSVIIFTAVTTLYAGNKDRAGEAGASQILINPWTKSVGFGGANSASTVGLEAMGLNIAGMAFTKKQNFCLPIKIIYQEVISILTLLVFRRKLVKQE